MHRLILLRHGKAEPASASGDDFERGLVERGRREAALIGRLIAEAGFAPDVALVSTARRARETWDEAAEAFPGATVAFMAGLYLADTRQIDAAVSDAMGESVMVVGHNPGLHEYALQLARQSDDPGAASRIGGFPTAAAAVFEFDADTPTLRAVFVPQDHRGGVA